MVKLIYIANQRMPTEKAYGLQIAKTCEALAQAGTSIELLVPIRGKSNPQEVFKYYSVKQNFSVTDVKSPDFYFWGKLDVLSFILKQWIAAVKLVRTAISHDADVIYSRDEFPIFLASFYKKHLKLIFEAHKFSSHRTWYYKIFKKMGVNIVTISQGIKDEFLKLGFKPENILVAHDGVDLGNFKVGKTSAECRELLGLPKDKKLVVYSGHLYDWKGANILLEAAKLMTNDEFKMTNQSLLFVFVGGTDADVKNFKDKAAGLDNVKMVGHVLHDKVPLYLGAADVLVLPNSAKTEISRKYTSPIKMFEYMASGRPIVTSDLPSIREILNENTAIFFKPDDLQDLAYKITKILENEARAEKLAAQAMQEAKKYSWQVRAKNILNFIQ